MAPLQEFAAGGGPVLGICNGFQVLTEAGFLPGALQKNGGLKFLCKTVELEVATTRSVLTSEAEVGQRLRVPINHFEGNYTCDDETLAQLQRPGPHRRSATSTTRTDRWATSPASATRRATSSG